MRKLILVFLALCLSGCANIPLSTILEYRNFNEQSFAAIDPSVIRSKILLSKPYALDLEKIKLSIGIEDEQRMRSFTFPLVLENESKLAAQQGFFSLQPARTQYTFRLSDIAIQNFVQAQKLFSNGIKRQASFSVGAGFKEPPKAAGFAYISVLLKLRSGQSFFSLIDNAELDLSKGS